MTLCFKSWASFTVDFLLTRSSTYRLLCSSVISSGFWWLSITPLSKNGEDVRLNSARVHENLKVSTSVSRWLFQWNLSTSLSSFLILTCKNACLRSPVRATGWKCIRTSTFQMWFWSGGPGYKQSFRLGTLPLHSAAQCLVPDNWSITFSAPGDSSFCLWLAHMCNRSRHEWSHHNKHRGASGCQLEIIQIFFLSRLSGRSLFVIPEFSSSYGFMSLLFFSSITRRGRSHSCQSSYPLRRSPLMASSLSSTLFVIPFTHSILPTVSRDCTLYSKVL